MACAIETHIVYDKSREVHGKRGKESTFKTLRETGSIAKEEIQLLLKKIEQI